MSFQSHLGRARRIALAQLCNRVPIAYNGMPKIHLQNCPFPFDDYYPHLSRTLSMLSRALKMSQKSSQNVSLVLVNIPTKTALYVCHCQA